jgi:hypothetical protein
MLRRPSVPAVHHRRSSPMTRSARSTPSRATASLPLALVLLAALVLLITAAPAHAAFPGANGRIAFYTDRDTKVRRTSRTTLRPIVPANMNLMSMIVGRAVASSGNRARARAGSVRPPSILADPSRVFADDTPDSVERCSVIVDPATRTQLRILDREAHLLNLDRKPDNRLLAPGADHRQGRAARRRRARGDHRRPRDRCWRAVA